MSIRTAVAAIALAAVALAACGGSSNDPPACAPSGTWQITERQTASTGGWCATFFTGTGATSTATLAADAATKTINLITADGTSTGTFDPVACTGTISATSSRATTDANGNPTTITETDNLAVDFSGATATGTGTIFIVSTPANAFPGQIPCNLTISIAGTRQ